MNDEIGSAILCACGCGKVPPIAPETRPKRGWVKGQRLRFYPHHSKNRWPVSDGVTKQCRGCLKAKPISAFAKHSGNADKLQFLCRECSKVRTYQYRLTDGGLARTVVARRKNHLFRFRITEADYEAMLFAQDGRCAICRKPESLTFKGRTRRLAVDHCHGTGKVRGLLCAHCNQALGKFDDEPSVLRRAAEYLEACR